MILREFINKIGFKLDENSLKNAEARVKAGAEKMGQVGRKMTLGLTLPIIGLTAAMVKMASDAEETSAKFGTVFQDVSEEAKAVSKNLQKNFGLSGNAARELLSDTGDLLTGFGFTGESALDLSKQVNELAVDLASFTNFVGGTEGASKALTKALLGERESVKSLGISILETDVKAKVLKITQEGMTFETERQAKAYATLLIAQEQSKNAIGDYARTSQGFANLMRKLRAVISNIAVAFGSILLPPLTKAAQFLIRFLEKLEEISPATRKFILVLLGLAAAIGPVLLGLSALIKMFFFVKSAYLAATLAAAKFNFMALLIPAIVVAILAALALFIQDLIVWVNGGDSLIGEFLGSWVDFKDKVIGIFKIFATIFPTVVAGWSRMFEAIKQIIFGFVDFFKAVFRGDIEGALDAIVEIFGGYIDLLKGMFAAYFGWFRDLFILMFPNAIEQGKKLIFGIVDSIMEKLASIPGVGAIAGLIGKGVDFFGGGGPAGALAGGGSVPISGPIGGGGKTTVSRNFNFKSENVLQVPPGTSDQQRDFLETEARRVYAEENEKMFNATLVDNPEVD